MASSQYLTWLHTEFQRENLLQTKNIQQGQNTQWDTLRSKGILVASISLCIAFFIPSQEWVFFDLIKHNF